MNPRIKKAALFILRWGIAIAGIWWVVANMSLRDHVLVLDARNIPHSAVLIGPASEDAPAYRILNPHTGETQTVSSRDLVNAPDRKQIQATLDGRLQQVNLLGMRLIGDVNRNPTATALLIEPPGQSAGQWIPPTQAPGYQLHVPHAKVHIGLITMTRQANPILLWAALLVFPLTLLITSFRWMRLMDALDIHLRFSRTFVLNMVGSFYNTFMPGSTGGDLLKAYYASKQTPHRVHAVMSVLVDRIIGLIALVILGGVMAAGMSAWIRMKHGQGNDPVARICMQVAVVSLLLMAGLLLGLAVIFHPWWRRRLGVDFLLGRLPMQQHVRGIVEVMECYRRHPMRILWAIAVSFPVHLTTIVVAILAGRAFGLPLGVGYYFVVVPVIVLVGAIPISPQGAGVMEYFAVKLTERQGATVGQAFALTMSIRVIQMLWNLSGGILVLRGGYHVPSDREQKEMEDSPPPTSPPPTPENEAESQPMASSSLQRPPVG